MVLKKKKRLPVPAVPVYPPAAGVPGPYPRYLGGGIIYFGVMQKGKELQIVKPFYASHLLMQGFQERKV
jgi:hypothetical protein